jgi:hypothetical protein
LFGDFLEKRPNSLRKLLHLKEGGEELIYNQYKSYEDPLYNAIDDVSNLNSRSYSESKMDTTQYVLESLKQRIFEIRTKFNGKYHFQISNSTLKDSLLDTTNSNDINNTSYSSIIKPNYIKIFVKTNPSDDMKSSELNNKTHALFISKECKIRELKRIIFDKEKSTNNKKETTTNVDDYIIVFNNNDLIDEELTLNDYGIQDKSTIIFDLY